MLSCDDGKAMLPKYDYTFWTGPIDEFFDHRFGRLSYRTVTFEKRRGRGDIQGNAVLNYTDNIQRWTRSHEHKYSRPGETRQQRDYVLKVQKETERDDNPTIPLAQHFRQRAVD